MFALLAISGSQGWSLTKNTALVVLVLLWLATAYWTFKDARRRIADPWLIGVATLVGLVHVADTLCAQTGKGFNLTAYRQSIDANLLTDLGLDSAALEQFKATIPALVSDAGALFG